MTEISEDNFSEYMEELLYGENGFYTRGGGAGRSRDYLTSPEVGDLFGRVIASFIDEWYESLETDEPAIVVDAGCGPGSLAASIARANMRNAGMIDYFLVDRSPVHLETADRKLSQIATDLSWSTYSEMTECVFPTLVIANELLDNLVFDIGFADELYKPFEPDEMQNSLLGIDAYAALGRFNNIDNLQGGNVIGELGHFRVPRHTGIANWFSDLSQATTDVTSLTLLIFDYMKPVSEMEDENWLRLYSDNKRVVGVDNVISAIKGGVVGDITTDVIKEDLNVLLDIEGFSRIKFENQAGWLNEQGIDIWCRDISEAGAYNQVKDWLEKDNQSSNVSTFLNERNILLDENGLGNFTVVTAKREI